MLVVLLLFIIAVVMIVIVVSRLILAYERREEQYKALVASLREARTDDAAIIEGLQQQVATLLEDKADLNTIVAQKDHHIDCLVIDKKESEYKINGLIKDRKSACEIADNLYRQ